MRTRHRFPLLRLGVVGLAGLLATACQLNFSRDAEARGSWTGSYTLAGDGTLEIRSTNGQIDLEAGEGDTVSIAADLIVKASTDEIAQRALAEFTVAESVTPGRVEIDTTKPQSGLSINLTRQVHFRVRLPRRANVTLRLINGDITAADLAGAFDVETTNSRIVATGLEGRAQVETTNGAITLDFAQLADGGVRCDTTNGAITVRLPASSGASLSARVTNGTISHEGLELKVSEQSRRRLEATLGGGGPEIRLETTNGLIRVQGRKRPF